jgi:hypothetical protein
VDENQSYYRRKTLSSKIGKVFKSYRKISPKHVQAASLKKEGPVIGKGQMVLKMKSFVKCRPNTLSSKAH